MDADPYLRKLHFRAHHRGTREADAMVGGFFDRYHKQWNEADFAWFERLLEEQDVDIMAWAMQTAAPDPGFAGPMMDLLQRLDFISLPEGLNTADK
ncbi:succinate dehydrogenase assembly factor 2 [Sphingorhabdus contaminans]|uniref:FAD assembly factor SdhE n=1 Tax=Sphingorhabdus contaminans TaxID=1343899 RepID=A0A553WID8_9SPHN|nr:succinate dehydrogenase assembly factor 2 [Sphingorhabdus contaminans]TSB04467.1 succinate dehydrogenase assembly factor 2 [Sphingorhabdus contaminans]